MKRIVIALAISCFAISVHAGFTTVTSQSGYLFKSDTTYYVPNAVTLSGTATFEGGAVIKYAQGASLTVSAINCTATAYHPVIFTAKDDDSVGAKITGSTGNPAYYSYANPALNFVGSAPWTMSNFRIANASQAIASVNVNVKLYHGQIVNCGTGISVGNASVFLGNLLFANVAVALYNITYVNIDVEHVTFSGTLSTPPSFVASPAAPAGPFSLHFTNCIFDRLQDFVQGGLQAYQTMDGDINGFTPSVGGTGSFGTSPVFSSATPFQSAGAGFYYLAVSGGFDASHFRGQGGGDIDPVLARDLKSKTTYPPIELPAPAPGGTTWNQNAIRESSSCDLGYHYDPLDYLCSQVALSSGPSVLGRGVAVGFYGASGFILNGGTLTSQGQATDMNRLVWYPSVQEQPIAVGGVSTVASPMFDLNQQSGVAKNITLNYADLSSMGGRQNLFAASTGVPYPVVTLNNCQLRGATLSLGFGATYNYPSGSACNLNNNLLERCTVNLYNAATPVYNPNGPYFYYQNPLSVTLYNNLFRSNQMSLTYIGAQESPRMPWTINDNLFDGGGPSFVADGNYPGTVTHTHNAYYRTTSGQLADVTDVTLSTLIYANGSLGNRYIGSAVPTISNAGSRSASAAGLASHTITPDDSPDANTVDIGFHYFVPVIRAGFDSEFLNHNDDNDGVHNLHATLPFTINFYGASYSSLFVNNNGNVTFTSALDVFTPSPLVDLDQSIIAPFWADVDTHSPCSDVVRYGTGTVNGRNAFGAEWVNVGYFAQNSDKLISAQLVLIDRSDTGSGNFDLEFNYSKIQWEAGDASGGCDGLWTGFDCFGTPVGGSPARAGFADSGGSFFELAGSGQAGAFLDSNLTSGLIYHNFISTIAGRYMFQFRNGTPVQTP
jgi:hypothetical protein